MSRLGERVRTKILAGILPMEPPTAVIASYGVGDLCAVCEEAILPADVEWSYRDHDVTRRFHIDCHRAWLAQLQKLR